MHRCHNHRHPPHKASLLYNTHHLFHYTSFLEKRVFYILKITVFLFNLLISTIIELFVETKAFFLCLWVCTISSQPVRRLNLLCFELVSIFLYQHNHFTTKWRHQGVIGDLKLLRIGENLLGTLNLSPWWQITCIIDDSGLDLQQIVR